MTHYEILPPEQKQIWPQLRPVPDLGFVLYGGTAIALRLGHRQSVDFDFFSDLPLDRDRIIANLPWLRDATTIQDQPDTWVVVTGETNVRLVFFGGLLFGRVAEPEYTTDGTLQMASFQDLMATKLKVILQRAEAKDYRDIAAMIQHGVSLADGLGAARAMYGPNFQPEESLKALGYFGDGDLGALTLEEKKTLLRAARSVRSIPDIRIRSTGLCRRENRHSTTRP